MAGLAAIVPMSPELVERWFSAGLYQVVQRTLTPASNLLPVAWLDLLIIAAVTWLAWTWTVSIRSALRTRRSGALARAAARTLLVAASVYLAFLLLWGLNYRRVPMTDRLEMNSAVPAKDAVVGLALDAASRLNALHARAHIAGWPEPVWRGDDLRRAHAQVQQLLADTPPVVPGRLKRTLLGPFFRWTAVDGMINPFGLEVLVNPDLLPFERPFVTAHEWAHLAGYADESEANFVGWLACLRAGTGAQYSGWLYLYWQLSGELGPRDRERVAETLAGGPRRDLATIAARLRRGDLPLLRRASWKVYDQYLKANRVEEGARSYGAVVNLILRARFEDGWRPVRRGAGRPGHGRPAAPGP